MSGLTPPAHVRIAEYLAGEETAAVKHEYIGGIPLPEIEATLPLAEIYARAEFKD